MTISITLAGTTYTYATTDAQLAALDLVRIAEMQTLPDGVDADGKALDLPIAQRAGYIADAPSYLQFAMTRSGMTGDGVVPFIDKWLNSLIELPPSAQYLPPPPPSPPPTLSDYSAAIQGLIDSTARAREYLDGTTCASYASSTIASWKADALAFIAWRDSVWVSSIATQSQAAAGTIPAPTVAALIAGLPAIVWPA